MKVFQFLRDTALWIMALPLGLVFVGAASNQAVLIANHGKFPVLLNDTWARHADSDGMLPDYEHCVMTSKTHLNALADVFNFGSEIDSVGDLALYLGGVLSPICPIVWLMFILPRLKRG